MRSAVLLAQLRDNTNNAVICKTALGSLAMLTQDPVEVAALTEQDVETLLEVMSHHIEDHRISGLICMVLMNMADKGATAVLLKADIVMTLGAFLAAQLEGRNENAVLSTFVLFHALRTNPQAQTEMIREGILRHVVKALELFPENEYIQTTSEDIASELRNSHRAETLRQLNAALAESSMAATIRRILGMPPASAPAAPAAPAPAAAAATVAAAAARAAAASPAAQADMITSAMRGVLDRMKVDGGARMLEGGFLAAIVQGLEHHPGHAELRSVSREMVDVFRASNSAETLRQLAMALSTSPHEARIREELGLPAPPPLPTVPRPSPFPVEAFEPAEAETVAIPAGGKSSDHAILCVLRHGALSAFALSEDTLNNYKTSPDWIVYNCVAGIEGFAIRRNQVKGEPLRRFNLDVPIYLRHSDAQQIVKGQTYLLTEGAERVGHIASERLLAETEKMYKGQAYNEGMAVSADHCQDDKPNKVYNVSLVAFGAAEGGRRTRRRWTHRKATRRVGRSRRIRRSRRL